MNRPNRLDRLAAPIAGAVLSLVAAGLAALAAPRIEAHAKPSLADLAFLVGEWRSESEGALLEEHWSGPAAGSLMGMFRWVQGGKVALYEFLVIEERPDGIVLTLRHFDSALVGREEKESPSVFRLARHAPGEVVFERVEDEKTATTILYRKEGERGLHSTVVMKRGGQSTTIRFDYARA